MAIQIDNAAQSLPAINPLPQHNYVAFFLTLACNFKCPYCINLHDQENRISVAQKHHLKARDWVVAANRLTLRPDLPLTLQGGEPTLHPGFYQLVNDVKPEIQMDLMTNLSFEIEKFIQQVPVWRFVREAPYAAIRVSYHPGQSNLDEMIRKTLHLQEAGFRIGLYGIEHPDPQIRAHIYQVRDHCLQLGLDFRLKEFLGEFNGRIYGSFKFSDCVDASMLQRCDCRTTEIIVDPSGHVFRCHADLYHGHNSIAHILDPDFNEASIEVFRECFIYGQCNPCDVKVKTNRFQQFGHTSVEIRNISSMELKES
jgi:hypothetical protein